MDDPFEAIPVGGGLLRQVGAFSLADMSASEKRGHALHSGIVRSCGRIDDG